MGVDLLGIGHSGLGVAKKSLQTAGHNISNANTEGYSRQRVDQATNPPIGVGNHVQGSGVYVRGINRMHDEHIEKRLNLNIAQSNYDEEKSFQLGQVEEVFNEINSEGLNKIINRFFNSFRELSTQPENSTVRSVVRENAKLVIKDFRRSRDRLEQIIGGMNGRIDVSVKEINNLMKNISELNVSIVQLEVTHGETGDLRDQRDRAVAQLAEYLDIHTFTDEKNRFTVNASGLGTLVSGEKANELMAAMASPENDTSYPTFDIYFKTRRAEAIGDKISKGKLAAMIEVRRDVARKMQDDLDFIAFNLVKSVNAIHKKGYGGKIFYGPDGELQQKTGINFFNENLPQFRAAEYIEMSAEVSEDVNNIVTALSANSPGDNRVSIAISKLQHEKVLHGGTTSFEEEYLKSVGDIGLLSGKTKLDKEQSEGLLAQMKQVKERISGVSIDEETANMVRFQHAYDASARVLKVADEMFKTVLGIKA